jgi:hypothetical protein
MGAMPPQAATRPPRKMGTYVMSQFLNVGDFCGGVSIYYLWIYTTKIKVGRYNLDGIYTVSGEVARIP